MLFQQDLLKNAIPWFVFEAAGVKEGLSCKRPLLDRDSPPTNLCVHNLQKSPTQEGRTRDLINPPAYAGNYMILDISRMFRGKCAHTPLEYSSVSSLESIDTLISHLCKEPPFFSLHESAGRRASGGGE